MIKVWGCSEAPNLQLTDFDTEKYKCIAMEKNPDGEMAIAFMSRTSDPPHFRVMCGVLNMFFTSRKGVLDWLEQFKHENKVCTPVTGADKQKRGGF